MTRIGIDCRFSGTASGLGRYTREVTSRLLARDDGWDYTLFLPPGTASWTPDHPTRPFKTISLSIPHYSLGEQTFFPDVIKSQKLDLLFVPHFNIPFFCPVPVVVTVHDLILHRYPNQASAFKRWAYQTLMKRAVSKAVKIIAVSQFTAAEVAHEYGPEAAHKTTVINEGVSDHFHPVAPEEARFVLQRYGISRPYFLYVGNAKQHKNVPLLLESFRDSGRTDADLILVTDGKEADRLTLPKGVRVLTYVEEADLPSLYSSAIACVTASLYEGFGLPLFEAAACGCPVIGTRCGALPELAPMGSLIVDPSLSAMTDAFRNPPQKRVTMPILPRWEDTTERTAALLREALAAL